MDNFYTSVKVLTELEKIGIYCCGTLRENRGGPKSMKSQIKKFTKGEGILMNKGGINYSGFKENVIVQIISNIHSAHCSTVHEISSIDLIRYSSIKQNEIIKNYNKFMGGVDLMDQMTKYYSIDKKSQKWTTKLVFHLFNIAFYNTFVLYKKTVASPKTYLQYLIYIIDFLVKEGLSANLEDSQAYFEAPSMIREKIKHFPIQICIKKRCKMCYLNKIRKETNYGCSFCKVPLCITPCFENWHNHDLED
jgi:hypothetical protein